MNEPVAINLSRGVGWSGSEILELVRDGESSMDLTFNYDGHPEIGTWQAALPREHFEAAWSALRVSGYQKVPEPSMIQPGMQLLDVGVRGPQDRLPRTHSFWQDPIPPEIAPTLGRPARRDGRAAHAPPAGPTRTGVARLISRQKGPRGYSLSEAHECRKPDPDHQQSPHGRTRRAR